jgi:hypothetical protein
MKFFILSLLAAAAAFISLLAGAAANALPPSTAEHRISAGAPCDLQQLSRAYYTSLAQVALEDAERFERLLEAIESLDADARRCYYFVLFDLLQAGRLDSFHTLFPLLAGSIRDPFILQLMVKAVELDLRDLAEHIFRASTYAKHDDGAASLIRDARMQLNARPDPEPVFTLLEWIGQIDSGVAQHKAGLYTEALRIILKSWDEAAIERQAQRLIGLGAQDSDEIREKYRRRFPGNENLQMILSEIPTVKMPEC